MPFGPPNLAPVANRFSTPVTRRRYGAPVLTAEGLLAEQAPTDLPGRAHHWPARGETLERLEEGTQSSKVREGTTRLDLRIEDLTTTPHTRADSLLWNGVEYQVIESSPRNVGPGGVVTWRSFVMVRL